MCIVRMYHTHLVGARLMSRTRAVACSAGQQEGGTAGGQHGNDDDGYGRWLRLLRAFLRAQGGMTLAQAFMAGVLIKVLA
jgi:hypothetical protein